MKKNKNLFLLKSSTVFLCIGFFIVLVACNSTKKINTTPHLNNDTCINHCFHNIHFNDSISLFEDSNLKFAHIGISVFNPKTNSYLYNYQEEKYFLPASNTKIATCYAALKYFGDSIIGLNFEENDSILFIGANADPSFLNNDFKSQKVFDWLITKKDKKIVLCNAKFNTTALGKGWSWDDFLENYAAERSSFPIYGNLVEFYYNNGYKCIPSFFEKDILESFEASNGDMKFKVSRVLGKNKFTINPGKKMVEKITFSTNENYNEFINLLEDTLKRKIERAEKKLINKFYSQSTDSILKIMMFNSDNFLAEQCLLMMSNEKFGLMNEEKIIDYLLKNDFNNLPQKPRWVDGSGLSRYNLFSPNDFVFILNKMKNEFDWNRISTIFPTATQGTLKNQFKNYKNKIFAKSGSFSNNISLSGFLTTKKGEELIFSVMINNHNSTTTNARNAIEKFLSNIIDEN